MIRELPSQERLNTLLDYKPTTGALYWKPRVGDDRATKAFNTKFAGKPAGTLDKRGYFRVMVDKEIHLVARVVWTMVNGPTDKYIDHKKPVTGKPSDNKLSNLRAATPSENRQNSRLMKDKDVALKGVTKIGEKYRGSIRIGKKTTHLGLFTTPEEAHAAYVGAAKLAFGEFARAA